MLLFILNVLHCGIEGDFRGFCGCCDLVRLEWLGKLFVNLVVDMRIGKLKGIERKESCSSGLRLC